MAAKTEIRNGETELITSSSASNSSNIDHRQSDWRSVIASASPVGSEIGIAQIGSEIPSSPSPCRLDVLPSPTALPFGLSLPTPSTLSLLYTFLLSDSLFFSNGFLSTLTSLYLFLSSEERNYESGVRVTLFKTRLADSLFFLFWVKLLSFILFYSFDTGLLSFIEL